MWISESAPSNGCEDEIADSPTHLNGVASCEVAKSAKKHSNAKFINVSEHMTSVNAEKQQLERTALLLLLLNANLTMFLFLPLRAVWLCVETMEDLKRDL